MSTLWNTPRGEKLFRISLTGMLEDPDATEFPTPAERAEIIDALTELTDMATREQTNDFVAAATEFLHGRGTTIHEFSLGAIKRVRGQVPMQSARISMDPEGETLTFTSATDSDETMEAYVNRVEAEQGTWDFADVDTVMEADDISEAISVSVERFAITSGEFTGSTNTMYWPDGRSAAYDTTDIGFWVQDYLFVMNLLAAERRIAGP